MTNYIEIDYVDIENSFSKTIAEFSTLCDSSASTLQQIADFIKATKEFDQLTSHYRYCQSLNGAYQGFSANNQNTIKEIADKELLMLFNKKEKPEYDLEKNVREFKEELKNRYTLWSKAYAVNKAYRLCHEDKSIMTFSHRIDGWSNPLYQLTPNFSVEIKTNFGYGRTSYFYTKLKYKDIEILPFSEWIKYADAKFSEIVRYTKSHVLQNEYWLEAMEFARDACNLSMTDEQKFVEKHVIAECEIMVSGLEKIFHNEQFLLKTRAEREYTVDKKGHVLVEFRGEKISGALDFISKILEFDRIVSVKSFIERIEACNKRIQPILIEEAKIIKLKIVNLTNDRDDLKPSYEAIVEENNEYNRKRMTLQKKMLSSGQLKADWIDTNKLENKFTPTIGRLNADANMLENEIIDVMGWIDDDTKKFEKEFNLAHPEYVEFKVEYKRVTESFHILNQQILNFNRTRDSIVSYNNKIVQYFGG